MASRDDRTNIFHVSPEAAGKTLGELVRRAADVSWGEAERRILSRLVSVHGNLCVDPARRLKAGDVINLHAEAQAKLPEADDLEIVFKDRHILVVEKPAGLTSVREPREKDLSQQRRERQPTLDELLEQRLRKGEPPHRRGPGKQPLIFPVHRLDRDTSGLMLFARTADAERELVRRFQAHDIHRAYLAVVHGRPVERTINTLITRDRGDGKRGSVPQNVGSAADTQRAITHIRPVQSLGAYTVVECRLETGRTHQIRIHLGEIGHPICGDKLYGLRDDKTNAPRHALHAYILAFEHPITGNPLRFQSNWPDDLRRWLNRLR